MRPAGLYVTALMLLCCIAAVRAEGTLQVTDPWIREAPPGATVLAGYLTLTNGSDTPVVIEAVSSPAFEAVEIHRSWIEDGIAHMQPVPALTIPAAGSISLAPGSYHLMLIRPVRALSAGDHVTLLLRPTNGACITITAPVLRPTESSPQH